MTTLRSRARFAMLWIRDWWIAALVLLVFCGASVAGVIIYVRSNRVAVRADDLRVGDCIKEAAENVLPDWADDQAATGHISAKCSRS